MNNLPIIQKTYDLIKWYVPILARLPRSYKFNLGDRLTCRLYELLEELIIARYEKQKIDRLEKLNSSLEIIRYQTRLIFEFNLMDTQRYEHVSKLINEIGIELGGWIKQQKGKSHEAPRKPLAPNHPI
jgi:hypothetical protein